LFVTGDHRQYGLGTAATAGTHHPQRHSDLYAYNALAHRHAPEVAALAQAATGVEAQFNFVPHSGPFARAASTSPCRPSHALRSRATSCCTRWRDYYDQSVFVRVGGEPPRVKDVVASNFAQLSGVATANPWR